MAKGEISSRREGSSSAAGAALATRMAKGAGGGEAGPQPSAAVQAVEARFKTPGADQRELAAAGPAVREDFAKAVERVPILQRTSQDHQNAWEEKRRANVAAQDALLADWHGVDDETPPATPAEEPVTTEPETPEPEAEPPSAEAQPQPHDGEAAEEVSAEQREDYEKALLGLKLARVSMETIQSMDVDQVLAIGLPLRESQIEAGVKVQKLALQRKQESPATREGESDEAQAPALELQSLKGLVSELESLGADAKVLRGFEQELRGEVARAVADAISPIAAARGYEQRELERLLLKEARESLVAAVPDLADDRNWKKVEQRVRELAKDGHGSAFGSIEEAVEFAAFQQFGRKILEQRRGEVAARNKRRSKPSPVTSAPMAAAMSRSDWELEMARAAVAGDVERMEAMRARKPVR